MAGREIPTANPVLLGSHTPGQLPGTLPLLWAGSKSTLQILGTNRTDLWEAAFIAAWVAPARSLLKFLVSRESQGDLTDRTKWPTSGRLEIGDAFTRTCSVLT